MVTWDNGVAVVTGGASGIGRALALALADRGARVAVVDVERDRAASVADEIKARGGTGEAFGCDVSDGARMLALAQQVQTAFGGANFLFNNAGVVVGGTVEDTSPADAQWLFTVNVMGVFNGIKAFLPLLRAARGAGQSAHIVNTGSENSLGLPALGPNSVYTATKHALLGLTDALRRDLTDTGVGVTLLCPGLVSTDVFDARRNRPDAFGGPQHVPAEQVARIREMMAKSGQDPMLTAELCLEGMERGEFLVITDPNIRAFATKRQGEVDAALDRIDSRLS